MSPKLLHCLNVSFVCSYPMPVSTITEKDARSENEFPHSGEQGVGEGHVPKMCFGNMT